jgi:hypothetical protein
MMYSDSYGQAATRSLSQGPNPYLDSAPRQPSQPAPSPAGGAPASPTAKQAAIARVIGPTHSTPYFAPGGQAPSSPGGFKAGGGSGQLPSAPGPQPNQQAYAHANPQAAFKRLFPGATVSPQELAAKEAELAAAGMRLMGPNAQGMRTKVQLQDGRVIDLIRGAAAGHNVAQWMEDRGAPGGGGAPAFTGMGMFGGSPSPIASGNQYTNGAMQYLAQQLAMKNVLGQG